MKSFDDNERSVLDVFRYLGPKVAFDDLAGMFYRSGGDASTLEGCLVNLINKSLLNGPFGTAREYHLTARGIAAVGRWQVRD